MSFDVAEALESLVRCYERAADAHTRAAALYERLDNPAAAERHLQGAADDLARAEALRAQISTERRA